MVAGANTVLVKLFIIVRAFYIAWFKIQFLNYKKNVKQRPE